MRHVFLAVVVSGLAARVACAQPVPVTDQMFLRAAIVVTAFDRYAAACAATGGFSAAQAIIVNEWHTTQRVELIRGRLPELAAHPVQQQQLDTAVDALVDRLAALQIGGCPAATSVTRLPEAQFATVAPALLMAVDAAAPAAPAPPAAAAPDVTPQALLAAIDSYGFHSRPTMGAGGFVVPDIFPVVLLRSGELLKDVSALRFSGGLEAHRAAHPDAWTQWRRHGGRLELLQARGWTPLAFPQTYSSLPPGLQLDGLYRRTGGSGNLAVGGADGVTVWDEYHFFPDGRLERSGGAGGTAAFGDTALVTRHSAPRRTGRYRIEGLTLNIDYTDGSREQRILITQPDESAGAGKVVWIDGAGYLRRK